MTTEQAIAFLNETVAGCAVTRDKQIIEVCNLSISALRAQQERENPKPQWISVKDGLPENEEDAVPVVYGRYCIDIVDFIDWLDVGHLRSADEKCFSEANVAGMLKDFAITNPAIPDSVTRCKDCRYGLPCKLFGRDAITCMIRREEIHLMDWYCADAAKTDGKDDAK